MSEDNKNNNGILKNVCKIGGTILAAIITGETAYRVCETKTRDYAKEAAVNNNNKGE